jgi:hypothetical protein
MPLYNIFKENMNNIIKEGFYQTLVEVLRNGGEKKINNIDCGVYVCMNVDFIAYQLSLLSITVEFVET